MKRGVLEVCVLAALRGGDSYGYKIIKDIQPYIEISESTLYPILKRLEMSECVLFYTAEHNGRLRKYYHITDKGQQRIRDFIDELQEMITVYEFIKREQGAEIMEQGTM
jgi:PadR family transcriptional regulator PadR